MVPEVERHKFMEHKGLSIDGDKGGDSMRRKMLPIAILAMLALGCSAKASAQDIAIDETNFPDPGLREYVQTAYDTNKDGVLSDEENAAAKEMNVYFNADPKLMITVRRQNDTHDDLGDDAILAEFPCDQISEYPLKDFTYMDRYVVGCFPWNCVINQSVTSLKGIEHLTSLKRVTLGGDVSKKLVISGNTELNTIQFGGVESIFESVLIKDCPKLQNVYISRTAHLSKLDLSGVSGHIKYIGKQEYTDSLEYTNYVKLKDLDSLVVGNAGRLSHMDLPAISIRNIKINYTSLKRIEFLCFQNYDPKQNIDLSKCKNLRNMSIYEKYHTLILPDQKIKPAYSSAQDTDIYYELIPFAKRQGPRIIDASLSQKSKDYVASIIKKWLQAVKKDNTYTRTLVLNRKIYNSQRKKLRSLEKYGIRIRVKE